MGMNTKFMLPRLDNYYSDYIQLSFSLNSRGKWKGFYSFTEDPFGKIYSQEFTINLARIPFSEKGKKWQTFLDQFISTWLHEWLHLVGLTDEGIDKIKELGFPVG